VFKIRAKPYDKLEPWGDATQGAYLGLTEPLWYLFGDLTTVGLPQVALWDRDLRIEPLGQEHGVSGSTLEPREFSRLDEKPNKSSSPNPGNITDGEIWASYLTGLAPPLNRRCLDPCSVRTHLSR
jgi:hypothetical protein